MYIPEGPEPETAGELLDLAFELEAYVNDHTRLQRKRARDAEQMLNDRARDLYGGLDASLSGSILVSSYDKERGFDEPAIEAIFGNVDGANPGFTVTRMDLLEKACEDPDEESSAVLDYIRERINGSFVVCHVIDHQNRFEEERSLIFCTTRDYRAVGPIATSYLLLDQPNDPLPLKARRHEAERLVEMMPQDHQVMLSEACQEIVAADNPMEAIVFIGGRFQKLLDDLDALDRTAIVTILNSHFEGAVVGRGYDFSEGLPPSISPISATEARLLTLDGERLYLEPERLVVGAFYENGGNAVETYTKRRSALYVQSRVRDRQGNARILHVPAEYMEGYPSTEVGLEDE